MEPSVYVPAYLEHAYLASHEQLTPGGLRLLREEIRRDPAKYATDDHARALLSYWEVRDQLLDALWRMQDLPDDEFDRQRNELFDAARVELARIGAHDRMCIDARLTDILLADVPVDACLTDLMALEREGREHLAATVDGFDAEGTRIWPDGGSTGGAAAEIRSNPVAVGWLHTIEAIAQLCLASARYRAAAAYAQRLMRADGFWERGRGVLLLALARLEDERGFFELASDDERRSAAPADAGADADETGGGERAAEAAEGRPAPLEDSPWYLLGRTILLYKLGRRKNARRALRDLVARCEGAAFFLLNPTFLEPYLPVRPPAREAWELTHQAVWEADGILADTPDFADWAASVEGVADASERFAARYGF